jgi:hypothetical protein
MWFVTGFAPGISRSAAPRSNRSATTRKPLNLMGFVTGFAGERGQPS